MPNLPVPNPRTFVAGEYEAAAYFNALRDAITFLANPPIAELYQSGAQSFPNSAWTSVQLNATTSDTYGGHSNVTNNSRYTAVVAGFYELSGSGSFVSNATGVRAVTWAKNGSIITTNGTSTLVGPTTGNTTSIPVPTLQVFLNPGDYVELQAFQNSGAALNADVGQYAPQVGVKWIHA